MKKLKFGDTKNLWKSASGRLADSDSPERSRHSDAGHPRDKVRALVFGDEEADRSHFSCSWRNQWPNTNAFRAEW